MYSRQQVILLSGALHNGGGGKSNAGPQEAAMLK